MKIRSITITILPFVIGLSLVNRPNHIIHAQTIREYTVHRTTSPITIDGHLTETDWLGAALTEKFVIYQTGAATHLSTQAKFLWDSTNLYVGFICEDPDVWATMVNRDDKLWNGEVVEILCDPDGDGLNYFEVQANPLGTLLDLKLNKPYYAGGTADLSWTCIGYAAGIWIDGTLNNLDSIDRQWCCEVKLPFKELASMGPTLHFPPIEGESWRILVTRYDYERTGSMIKEVSSWNQTDTRGFHVPDKFGRIFFSNTPVMSVQPSITTIPSAISIANFPNPFNPSTTIEFSLPKTLSVRLAVYDIVGQEIELLADNPHLSAGKHFWKWNAKTAPSGIYFMRLETSDGMFTKKITLVR